MGLKETLHINDLLGLATHPYTFSANFLINLVHI